MEEEFGSYNFGFLGYVIRKIKKRGPHSDH